MGQVNQYDIVLVNLDPARRSEMKKTRACIVLSPNEMNKYLQMIVVAPMTSSSKSYPTRVEVKYKATEGWIAIDQIRTIDRLRIVKRFESLTTIEIEKVKGAILETFVA